jgi:hypothetical protein
MKRQNHLFFHDNWKTIVRLEGENKPKLADAAILICCDPCQAFYTKIFIEPPSLYDRGEKKIEEHMHPSMYRLIFADWLPAVQCNRRELASVSFCFSFIHLLDRLRVYFIPELF